MGRKGGKKYRREIRKEQSERDKDALFWKLGRQLSDPLGEYREFIANIRNKEFNEVDDYIDIPINLVDLTANLITSLITGENCLYESINESDKRSYHSHKKEQKYEIYSDIEEEVEVEEGNVERNNSNSNLKSNSKENINNENKEEIKFTKIKPNSNSSTFQKNKSYSFNFEEYCQHENEESFHFIRKIIKKTQLSLTTFIVGLFFIYSYKHMEKDKRKYREHKVSKYINDWSITSPKKTKKKRKRKNKNRNNNNVEVGSDVTNEKESFSSQDIKSEDDNDNKINKSKKNDKIYSLDNNPSTEFSSDSNTKTFSSNIKHKNKNIIKINNSKKNNSNSNNNSINTDNNDDNDDNFNNKIVSPILKTEFLSSFQPRNPISSNISKCSSIETKIIFETTANNDMNKAMAQYPSPSRSNCNDEENIGKNEQNNLYQKANKESKKEEETLNEKKEDNDTNNDIDNEDNNSNDDNDDDDDDQYEKTMSYQQLADKLLYDATYTNLNWSEFTEGRYTLEDINELERRFLSIMNFQLFISQKKFDEFLSYLDFILCLQKIRAWGSIPFALSYSDIYTLTKKMDTKYFDAYPNNKNNIYETLKKIFKIICGFLFIYLILLFIYILWKNYN
ncbi:hypothetical protein PIROE2DRAFT_60111 [Piromyces sp. E2]|nr:hypothetical protein PIROE2DRAFT_60111 [Piromyces sp. E2]|eukprot:OUM65315.1 hypothetical protein PIROE2DRAFT_60111 [Piromyces sp. E2]